MTSITLPRFKSKDGIAYSQIGKGVPIVFIHGVGLRSEAWYQQVDALKYNYSVFTMDMPGHGESDLLDVSDPTLYDFTEKLAKFMIDVVQQPAIIIGHSMGGLLSLSLAKEYPELCLAVVAMNTIYKRSDDAKRAVQLRAASLQNLSHSDACAPISRWFSETPSRKDAMHAELCREWLMSNELDGYAAAYKIFAAEDGPATASMMNLNLPVLYITGALDLNSNVSMTNAMASITPNAESLIVENSRHMTPLTHALQVNVAIIKFLQKHFGNSEVNHV